MLLNSSSDEPITKGQFAQLIGVSPGRVSQMISEGKISGTALVGEGRNAKIIPMIAKHQIKAKTDVGQSLGNGLGTKLAALGYAPMAAPAEDSVSTQLRAAKLEQIQFANRKSAEDELERRGVYVRADATKAAMTRLAVQMLTVFEGSLTDFSAAIAAKFDVPQRDVLHLMRSEFREIRTKVAETSRKAAVDMPHVTEDTVADASDQAMGEALANLP
jgi:hypothetical protein